MEKAFDEVFEDVTKFGTKVQTSEYHENGKNIIIDQGQKQIAGYTDEEDGLFYDVPAIIFGDHTRVIKYVDKPFFLGADGVKVLRCKLPNANYKFLYYMLKSVYIPNTGYNRHFKCLKEAKLNYSPVEMQKEIVCILDKVSDVIEKRQKQLILLDELVKARFVEMFEKQEYPIEKLGKVCLKITDGTHKTPNYLNDGVTFISAKNIVNGELDFTDIKHISEEEYQEIQKRCQTELFDILLSKSGSLGSPVIVKTTEKLGLFESLAVIKYDRDKLLPEFLCEQLKTDRIQRQFTIGTKGIAIKHLHLGVIGDTDIIVPSIEEQEQFADFVKQVDKSKLVIRKALEESQVLYENLMQEFFG
jgi:type I restriction enzyme S subunit